MTGDLDGMKKSLHLRYNFPTSLLLFKKIRKARKTGVTLIKQRSAYYWIYNIDIHRFYLHSEGPVLLTTTEFLASFLAQYEYTEFYASMKTLRRTDVLRGH